MDKGGGIDVVQIGSLVPPPAISVKGRYSLRITDSGLPVSDNLFNAWAALMKNGITVSVLWKPAGTEHALVPFPPQKGRPMGEPRVSFNF